MVGDRVGSGADRGQAGIGVEWGMGEEEWSRNGRTEAVCGS